MTDTAERMRKHAKEDHAKGCQGREYYCRCGYDEKTGPLLFEAADAIERLRVLIAALTNLDFRALLAACDKAMAALDEQVAK